MALLHIFDSANPLMRQTARARTDRGTYRLGVAESTELAPALDGLIAAGQRFDRVLFQTHGRPGRIYFNGHFISASWWRAVISRGYTRLTTADARVYFNGCNVADGPSGWDFLEAVARVFLMPGGGEVWGQTGEGFALPFLNGHVVHPFGSTRTLFVDVSGRVVERFEQ